MKREIKKTKKELEKAQKRHKRNSAESPSVSSINKPSDSGSSFTEKETSISLKEKHEGKEQEARKRDNGEEDEKKKKIEELRMKNKSIEVQIDSEREELRVLLEILEEKEERPKRDETRGAPRSSSGQKLRSSSLSMAKSLGTSKDISMSCLSSKKAAKTKRNITRKVDLEKLVESTMGKDSEREFKRENQLKGEEIIQQFFGEVKRKWEITSHVIEAKRKEQEHNERKIAKWFQEKKEKMLEKLSSILEEEEKEEERFLVVEIEEAMKTVEQLREKQKKLRRKREETLRKIEDFKKRNKENKKGESELSRDESFGGKSASKTKGNSKESSISGDFARKLVRDFLRNMNSIFCFFLSKTEGV